MERVHLDHNATTPLRPEAREALLDALDRFAANPSSVHRAGRAARQALDDARERVAVALGVTEDEVLFVSGGTEAVDLAVLGTLEAARTAAGGDPTGVRLVTTTVEHAAVLGAADRAQALGHPVTRVGVDRQGRVDPQEVAAHALATPVATLLSVQAANNETGACHDLHALARALGTARGPRPWVHVDAAQALGRIPLDLDGWGAHLVALSLHKVGGPLGAGVLVRRGGVPLAPLLHGGGQESGLRPGTENLPAIVAGAVALELAVREQEAYRQRTSHLVRLLWHGLQEAVPGLVCNGPQPNDTTRLPNTLNVSVPDVDGRMLVTRLDLAGLEASAGSACSSGSLEPSHVLRAMGLDDERARGGLRLSVGRTTDEHSVHIAVEIMRRTLVGARKS